MKNKIFLLLIIFMVFLSGCLQQKGVEKIEAKPECGNYLPKGWICPPSQEFISQYNLTKVNEVKANLPIELYNFTITPILNQTSILVENIPEFFLFALARLLIQPTMEMFIKLTILPLEFLAAGNITIEEIKQQPNVKIYEAEENKKFAIIYLILDNHGEDYKINGRWEGVLVTDKQKYLPKYFLRHDRLWPTEQLGNYTILDLASYSVKPNSTEITFLVFEIGKDEKMVEFIFNTTYAECKLICLGENRLQNMVVKI